MRAIAAFVVLLAAGLVVAAMPWGEKKVSSDGYVVTSGATHVALLGDGESQIRIVASDVRRPYAAAGDTFFTLLENQPREFAFPGSIDTVHVATGTASYVLVTWGSW